MKQVIRYKCDFCNYTKATKKTVLKHEIICFKNPASKSCITCSNFKTNILLKENGLLLVSENEYEQSKASSLMIETNDDDEMSIRYCSKYQNLNEKLKTNCCLYNERLKNN